MNQALLLDLYQRYHRELVLYLCGLCGDRARAEDLMQETFLKAILSLPDGHPNFRAWLYLVARNLWLNQQRTDHRLTPLDQAAQLPADDPSPGQQLIADETQRLLYQALNRLEPRKREILLLQYFSRLPQKEIAAILHLTPEYVRVLSGRARRALKGELEALGYDNKD